jgi:hypothetical protein
MRISCVPTSRLLRRAAWFLALLVGAAAHTGCTTLSANLSDLGIGPRPSQAGSTPYDPSLFSQPSSTNQPTIVMEVIPATGSPKRAQLPLEGPLTIQEALMKAGVTREFRRMNIVLHRMLPGGVSHKLDIEYDRRTRRVTDAYDYALRPQDRLVVTQDTSTTFDDMLDSVTDRIGL